jgi:twinkle protein
MLADLLDQNQIRLKSLHAGHTEHVICPHCGGGKTREKCLSVTIDQDGDGATWICHRATCPSSPGGARVTASAYRVAPRRPWQRPAEHTRDQQSNRPQWLYEAFSARQIGARVIHALGIYAVQREFGHPFGKLPTVVFPYRFNGEIVNRKYRSHPKQTMAQERDAQPTLYNVDSLGAEPEEIIWVEGEMDVAAIMECGLNHAVSLKDGAPASVEAGSDPEAKRFQALATHADLLAKPKRIVLAGDMDAPGLALREILARRLGRHRCWLVTWPDGHKDAGDVLRELGPDAVLAAIQSATPYPIEGLNRVTPGTLRALRAMPPPGLMTTGTDATDRILKLPAEGRLIIVTGVPGSGKTNWTRFVMVHVMKNHNRKWAVFSPEMQPWESFVAECAEVLTLKSFYQRHGLPSLSDDEIDHAERWFEPRLVMLVCDAENQAPTLDWLLEHATISVLRDGTTDLLIDPWNEVETSRGNGQTETEQIGKALQRFKAFALRHGCNVWITAHPSKPDPKADAKAAPGPYQIAGCYSEDTEVLTADGWKHHIDISSSDKVCCFDPTANVLIWQSPSFVHAYPYEGQMHHYNGYSLDLLVTPNHRMVVQAHWTWAAKRENRGKLKPEGWAHKGWQFETSDRLRTSRYKMPLAAPLQAATANFSIPGVANQEAGWSFVGWYVTEGSESMRAPSVCQAEKESAGVRETISALGVPFSERLSVSNIVGYQTMWVGRIKRRGSEEFCDWILRECGKGAPNKRLPSVVWTLPKELKEILFTALIAGDGHERPYNPDRIKQGGYVYSTTSRQLADEVQRLAIELGMYASVSSVAGVKEHHHTRYWLTIGHRDRTERTITLPWNREIVNYSGTVYCLTVPTGAYVTRRNGKMAICGNSAHWYNRADVGLTVHSPEAGAAEIHLWKARFRRFGRRGTNAVLDFDALTGTYSAPIGVVAEAPDWVHS